MEALKSCCCCLQLAQEKSLKAPHMHRGRIEIYEDMLMECFNIQIEYGKECGICKECVGCLRDASTFKLKVQNSQAKLKTLLDHQNGKGSAVKTEMADKSVQIEVRLYEETQVKSEMVDDYEDFEASDNLLFEERVKCESDDDNEEDSMSLASNEVERPTSALVSERRTTTTARLDPLCTENALGLDDDDDDDLKEMPVNTTGRRQEEEFNKCEICGQRFPVKASLLQHMQKHTTGSKHPLTNHKRTSPVTRVYSCDICSKKFTRKSDIKRHMPVHTGLKPYSCKTCKKKFGQKAHLLEHRRIHTGDRPFKCDICYMNFAHRSTLRNHMLLHKRDDGVSYTCETCNKQFTSSRTLIKHKRTHNNVYSCETCNKEFSQRRHLTCHQKIHGLKRFSCDTCNKQFTYKSNLTKHKNIHTGVKPYSCDICNKQFKHAMSVRRHKKSHIDSETSSFTAIFI